MSQRIAIIGAGGVGGLLAAMLARAGQDVRLLARGAALTAIRAHGVRLHEPEGSSVVPLAKVTDEPAELGVADLVLVAIKTWQLAELGPRLQPVVGDQTLVIPTQNGVEASEILGRALGDERVAGGVAHMISRTDGPGEVRWFGPQPTLRIGARSSGQRDGIAAAAETLRSGKIHVVVADDIEQERWIKFLSISAYAAVGAIARVPVGELRSRPEARARLEATMRETAALAAARGVTLPADVVEDAMRRLDALPASATASMHRNIVAGQPSELHELIGAVVRLGRESGVPTPVSAALYAELAPLEAAARARA
ncbi:MAG TPA: 2-dehydropantoate 2-reductase [Kofleriaceae bacterium]